MERLLLGFIRDAKTLNPVQMVSGDMNLILTYLNSEVSPSSKTMDDSADEISKYGKINNPQLISKLIPYGLTNKTETFYFLS